MDHTFLSVLLIVLGCVQLCDIFVSLTLYRIYNKNTDYLCATIIWCGAFIFFTSDVLLGEIGPAQLYFSFIFAGLSSIALGELTARLFELSYSWRKKLGFLILCYFLSVLFYLLGFREFWFLGAIIGVGVTAPQFYVFWQGVKKIKHAKKSEKENTSEIKSVDRLFLVIVFLWGIHLLDYPFLRPLTDIRFSVFGFSFALFLTYCASVLFPVMVNHKIYLQLTSLLSSQLDETSKQLDVAQQEVINKEKLAMVGTLTAGIAHEIKNPLNIIKNNNFLIKDSVTSFDDFRDELFKVNKEIAQRFEAEQTKLKKVSQFIEKNVDRADVIIKNMLMHSRKHKRDLAFHNINAIIEEAIQFYFDSTSMMEKNKVKTELSLSDIKPIKLSLPDISRALINILDNAFYALKKKESEKSDFQPLIKIKTDQNENFVFIEIEDNGIGISPDDLLKINDPFFTTKPTGEGTGLGMHLVNEIIDLHGGNMSIDSVEGQFTRIKVALSKNLT
ncbi:MAG: hypothetical protein CME62_05255 [Halobacteriovoraceae bacterium]|nr:hypothetical protein [Halobacteriovoraceae bacterium]|tara:strand:+ start:3244 stop:4746 length:1503 start_codon:yes stop_codon:yes gene_type:complete